MKNLTFWKSDWFLGLVVTLVLLVASGGDLIQCLEHRAYDLGVRSTSRAPSDRIAIIITIDDLDPGLAYINKLNEAYFAAGIVPVCSLPISS